MRIIATVTATLIATSAISAPVDLTFWAAEGGGTWNLQGGNNAVLQTRNGNPTVFHNNTDSQGKALAGTIKVQTTFDDDYIGFVLGYKAGDLTNAGADYLLIDWKQADQTFFGGPGLRGLAVSRVTGVLGNNSGAWWHDPTNNVTEIARATNLGSTGWADNTEYSFDLVFTSSLVEVSVNGVKEISINGSFADGAFGFYNYSQASVLYAGIEETVVPPAIPLPATLPLLAGALGLIGMMRKRRAA